jgi:ribosomal protein L25 (general stress protein Ctc)
VPNTIGRCGATIDYFSSRMFTCTTDTIRQLKGLPSGSYFDVGKTSIVFEVKRGDKKSICRNTIEVLDQENPIIVCPNDTTIYITTPDWKYINQSPIYSDNCMIDTVIRSDAYKSFSSFVPGSYKIQYWAIDVSGNKSSCVYNIDIVSKYRDTATYVAVVPLPIENVDTLISDSVVIDDPIQPIDTANMEIEDVIHVKGIYDFTNEYVTMVIYDHNIQDNDSISVYFNNKRIVDAQPVLLMKNGPIIKTLKLSKLKENKIVIQALNTGSTGKNTVKVDFYEGKNVNYKLLPAKFSKVYNSEPGRATAIKLNYKE